MYCDQSPTAGPSYRPEFRELQQPKIPPPRRNYQPAAPSIPLQATPKRLQGKPALTLTEADANRARKSANNNRRAK